MLLKYDLQFFAKDGPGGEKTEMPTSKKLDDARKKGQVAKSKEIANAAGIVSMFLLVRLYVGTVGNNFIGLFGGLYSMIPSTIQEYDGNIPIAAIIAFIRMAMYRLMLIVLPIFIVSYIVAFVSDLVQVKWRPTNEPLKPKFSKLNPISGFKKIFSLNSLVELIKSLIKLLLVGYMVYSYLKGQVSQIYLLYDLSIGQSLLLILDIVTNLGLRIAAVYLVIAAADFGYQKWKFREDMKMTKQEVKDEFKEQEGDPQIKGKQKQRMREASMRRMMQQLPTADVVITNPTHYAVAIRYRRDEDDAPVVIAKGADYLAQKIKDVARENDIYIFEDKPLARMLYANVDLEQAIPPELYEAVANVLAFVYQMQGKIGA
ncbi:MAG: flagellar biosynthesis protein FlhB [Lachnospiraceae bacterium]|nr:flagellar biosynthesis protein FlhB [Lachnospiraceae bacterium]